MAMLGLAVTSLQTCWPWRKEPQQPLVCLTHSLSLSLSSRNKVGIHQLQRKAILHWPPELVTTASTTSWQSLKAVQAPHMPEGLSYSMTWLKAYH